MPCVWTFDLLLLGTATAASTFQFTSPPGCLTDPWKAAPANISFALDATDPTAVNFDFDVHGRNERKRGWVGGAECQFIDMVDKGIYMRTTTSTFDLPPHEWLRVAATWLVRAAQIQFDDGTRHLTPGYPTAYDGQWMRDGYYGISGLFTLVNATHQREFAASAEWMFAKARPTDGIMPQYCPPQGGCQYGQSGDHGPTAPGVYNVGCKDQNNHACQDLDSASFAVKLAYHVWKYLLDDDDAAAKTAFVQKWAGPLERSLNATAKDPNGSGLLWSNTSAPVVGYGFQVR